MFDPVPWFVGGGAEHSPEVARLLAYAATGGGEGIATPSSLRVRATSTPSNQVAINIGAGIILNRAIGGTLQSYIARMPTTDTVTIAATTSSGPRTDLIVAQVEDPNMSGEPWNDPADPTVGPYVFTRVIPNVPSTTTRLQDVSGYEGRSAIALARVTLPANTATITNAMITDLRRMAKPRSERQMPDTSAAPAANNLTNSDFAFWPWANTPLTVDVPTWATHMIAKMEFLGGQTVGNAGGQIRLVLGTGSDLYPFGTYSYNYPDPLQKSRQPVVAAGTLALPASVRGTTQALRMQGLRSSGTGNLFTVDSTYYITDVQFLERAE